MTVRELYEYFMQCFDHGFCDAVVYVCDRRDNPLTDGICVADALRIEDKDGEKSVVLETG